MDYSWLEKECVVMAREINLLHPTLRVKVPELIERAAAAGINLIITQTLRSKSEQDEIYAQGRTQPGKIVTNAPYPQSLHNWGVAFDIAVIGADGKVTWDINWFKKAGPIGEALGLAWGGRWSKFPDYPHFELPNYSWSALNKQYGSPAKFIKTWVEEVKPMASDKVIIQVAGKTLEGKLIGDVTYAPIRDIAEALGKTVSWDGAANTVIIK